MFVDRALQWLITQVSRWMINRFPQWPQTSTNGRLSTRQVVICRVPHELLVHGKPEGCLDAQTALHVPHSQLHSTHGNSRSV